jgi:hypothetical protein
LRNLFVGGNDAEIGFLRDTGGVGEERMIKGTERGWGGGVVVWD